MPLEGEITAGKDGDRGSGIFFVGVRVVLRRRTGKVLKD